MVREKTTGKEYAVKAFCKESLEASNKGKAALVNEINLMRKVDSDYVAKLEAVYETQNSVYLVLEFLKGGPIFNSRTCQIEPLHAKFIIYQILKGVRDLRKRNIVHRDIKPDNIVLLHKDSDIFNNKLKIVDLGLGAISHPSTNLIHRKCGTPGFIAPEVINMDSEATAESSSNSDIFSAGVIFYFLITKKMPFDGEDVYEVLTKNKLGKIDFLLPELSKISESCRSLLLGMLELDPGSRITPEVALEHEYFADFSKYKTLVSLGELQTSLDPESDCEVMDKEIEETGDLAYLMQAYIGKQKASSNFQKNNSIFFNPSPLFQNSYNSPVENSSELQKNVTNNSELQQEQSDGE